MKRKLNRVTALLLAGAIAAGSGFTALAEEDTAAAGRVSSAAADTAENDRWYQEAIGFLAHLGIFTGDENGDMKPEANVTRAEIAAIILREMNISEMNQYKDTFYDVDDTHWAADIIQTAYDNGIINGYDDGSFEPDDDVTYEQAVKMVMCAINYESYAQPYGGYPNGYLKVADDEDVTEHVTGRVGEPLTRRNIAKLVYNSLTAPYPVATGASKGNIEYTKSSDTTILSELRDMYYIEGTITAAPGKSIDLSMDIKKQQIGFEGQIMDSEIAAPEQYVAQYVRLFYHDPDGKGSDRTAVYAVPLTNKQEEMTIDADDIASITTSYTGSSTSQVSYYKDSTSSATKKLRLADQPIIVYNDQPFTLANFASIDVKNSDGTSKTFDEFITPDEGWVRAVDFGKDGTYDILFVESYETSVVKVATSIRLQLEYPTSFGDIIKLDPSEDTDLNLKVYRDEEEAQLRELQEGDVVTIRMNANFNDSSYTGDKYITIEASPDYFDGTVNSVNSDEDGYHAVIDGDEYDIVNNDDVFSDIKALLNSGGKFYLNKFGTIAKVDGKITGGLGSGESYGWVVNIFADDDGDVKARLYTSEKIMRDFKLNGTVDYWGPFAASNARVSAETIDSEIDNSLSSFLTAKTEATESEASQTVALRLCKYKTNSAGEITKLYMAVDSSKVTSTDAVRVVTKDYGTSHTLSGIFAGSYYIDEALPQIVAPLALKDANDVGSYNYRYTYENEFSSATGSNDLGYVCFFADVKNSEPGITIRLTKSTSEAVSLDEYGTADDNPVIVVSSISKAVNDEDEYIYVIKGYRDGAKVEYKTATNVLVSQVTKAVWSGSNKVYGANTIWTNDYEEELTDVLHAGDIIGIDGTPSNAQVIIRMVDTKSLAEYLVGGGEKGTVPENQFRKDEMFSENRDRIVFGYVDAIRTSPIVQLDLLVDCVSNGSDDSTGDVTEDDTPYTTVGIADISRIVYFINISRSGKITVEKDVKDAYEIEHGDYVFLRNFKADAAREMYVIRYGG